MSASLSSTYHRVHIAYLCLQLSYSLSTASVPRNVPTRLVTVLRIGCSLGFAVQNFSANSDRIIRPEQTGLSGPDSFSFSRVASRSIQFRFSYLFSVVLYSLKNTKREKQRQSCQKKREKKRGKEITTQILIIWRPSSSIALVVEQSCACLRLSYY